jgi:hypothetical protein
VALIAMIPMPGRKSAWWFGCIFVLGHIGCVTTPYQFGRFHPGEPEGAALQPIVVESGDYHPTLDKIGRIVGMPARIMTLNKKVNNHEISPETLEKLQEYMKSNDITDVYVAVNMYDPKGQWKRLKENDRIDPLWRYSLGTMSWLGYTIFPNRVFGGDRYNAFTNSLNLSSDVPAMVLSEAAYAKDIHSQRHPGAYAAIVNDLPVLSVWRQSKAASDVLGYARAQNDWPVEKQAYHVLYPHMGSAIFGMGAPFAGTYAPYIGIGGAVVGHTAGRTVAKLREPKLPESSADEPLPLEPSGDGDSQKPSAEEPLRSTTGVIMHASYEESQADDSD